MSESRTDHRGNQWVSCDNCADWVLYENSKITTPFKDIAKIKTPFACRACNAELRIKNLEQHLQRIEESTKENKTRIDLETRVWADVVRESRAVKDEVKKAVETMGTSTSPSSELSPPQLHQVLEESAEVKRRELNIIVAGLPENDSDIPDLISYARSCRVLLSSSDIDMADRLGRPGAAQRLLKVKLTSAAKKRSLLAMRQVDSNDLQTRIFIRPDLTKAQMELDKKLRADLAIAGKDKFMIKHGKLIQRPTALSQQLNLPSSMEGPSDAISKGRLGVNSIDHASLEPKGKTIIGRTYHSRAKTGKSPTLDPPPR